MQIIFYNFELQFILKEAIEIRLNISGIGQNTAFVILPKIEQNMRKFIWFLQISLNFVKDSSTSSTIVEFNLKLFMEICFNFFWTSYSFMKLFVKGCTKHSVWNSFRSSIGDSSKNLYQISHFDFYSVTNSYRIILNRSKIGWRRRQVSRLAPYDNWTL